MKKVICCLLTFFLICASSLRAQLLWDFRGGVSYGNCDDLSEKYWNYMGELGIDIPLKRNFALEIALRYKNVCHIDAWDDESEDNYYWDYDGDEIMKASLLEVPFRLGYKIPLTRHSLVRLSAGPYVSAGLNSGFRLYQAGIATGAIYEYKRVNIGLNYNIPIHKAFDNVVSNGVFLTLGVKFKSSAWKSIGAVAAAVGATAVAVGSAVNDGSSQDVERNSGYGDVSKALDYTQEGGSSEQYGSSKRKQSEREKMQEKETKFRKSGAYTNLDRAYGGYESQLIKMKVYPERYNSEKYCDEIKDIQAKMKSIREKMEQNGVNRTKSSMENWTPDLCR